MPARPYPLSFLMAVSIALLLIACCSATGPQPPAPQAGVRDIFVVYDAWHAGIVLRRSDLSKALIPESDDFPDAEYLEFSWGDTDYFPSPDPGIRMALQAGLWSRGSVLHVVRVHAPLQRQFPSAQIARLPVSDEAYQRLVQFIATQFSRPGPGTRAAASPGLAPNARFYPSTGKFSIMRTCNTWVAQALEYAGLPVTSRLVITASQLGRRVKPLSAPLE